MPGKQDRLSVISALIRSGEVETQSALLAALKKRGLRVTQSTLSRDLAELGIRKQAGRYVWPKKGAAEPAAFDYSGWVKEIIPCGEHLIIVKTATGQAQPVALRIDHGGEPAMVATLAGDDVVFLATRNRRSQAVALRRLKQWFGG